MTIDLPASKSISNRLLILNAISNSEHSIDNLSNCDDTMVLKKALCSNLKIIDVGRAGTAMRFLTAYLSTSEGEWYLTGDKRMKQRPIDILVDAINNLGGHVEYAEKKGFPPLHIFGKKLRGGAIEVDGQISSQFISALLMIAPTMKNGLSIKIIGKNSSFPYINMTLSLMKEFGINYSFKENVIFVPHCIYTPHPTIVESDWSAASYWFEIMALCRNELIIYLKGLEKHSIQGDSVVASLFNLLGVKSKFIENKLKLEKSGHIVTHFNFDFTNSPDLVQTIAVTCAFLNVPFNLAGLHTLKFKETDRIAALKTELRKFGFDVKSNDKDNLFWNGKKIEKQSNINVKTYNDHRMAMSFAPAIFRTDNFEIENPKVVTKSYPKFWQDFSEVIEYIRELLKTTKSRLATKEKAEFTLCK